MTNTLAHLRGSARLAGFGLLWLLLSGCASVTNPVADGIPVRRLPPEVLAQPKSDLTEIQLSRLGQKAPDIYRIDGGDVLGVFIEGVLGRKDEPPPVNVNLSDPSLPPSMGFPIVVQPKGTISLPLIEPLNVKGLSIEEIQEAITRAYTVTKKILQPERARIIVTLQRRRDYHVLVVREDRAGGGANSTGGGGGFFGTGSIAEASGTSGKGQGFSLDLPAGQNDVMNALARSGGLPGFSAADEVIIERGAGTDQTRTIRIPLRYPKGQTLPFRPEDVILQSGDILYVPARDAEVFYTGGLLISGQWLMPRDYDLTVIQAISLVRGTLLNGGTSSLNNFSGSTTTLGLGLPNPSLVSVVRKLPNNRQIIIRVDVNRAVRDPREDILVKSDDLIIAQFAPSEGIVQYLTTVFDLNLTGIFVRERDLTGISTLNLPLGGGN